MSPFPATTPYVHGKSGPGDNPEIVAASLLLNLQTINSTFASRCSLNRAPVFFHDKECPQMALSHAQPV
jgi:hypothetical protein